MREKDEFTLLLLQSLHNTSREVEGKFQSLVHMTCVITQRVRLCYAAALLSVYKKITRRTLVKIKARAADESFVLNEL